MMNTLKFNKPDYNLSIDKNMPITDVRYIVVDTELTGLDEKKDSIVSIGAIRMTGGRIDLSDTFYRLIKPETALTSKSIVIHGITPSDVIKEPDIDKVLLEFSDFCGTDVIVGHFISIDMSFINREMKRIFGHPLKNAALDTFTIYEWLNRKAASHKAFSKPLRDYRLYEIARYFGVPVSGAHNAIMDAYITAQLFQRFIPILLEAGVRQIGYLLRAGNPSRGGDRFRLSGEASNF